MPPKQEVKKKKKKTKEELEAERLAAEEAARLAEEERLRAEEAERQRLAELEAQRQALLAAHLEREAAWVAAEAEDLGPLLRQYDHQHAQASTERAKAREWERFTACVYVPQPRDAVSVSAFLAEQAGASDEDVKETLTACQDCYAMITEARQEAVEAAHAGQADVAASLNATMATLHAMTSTRIDRATAHMLSHADEHANERGEVQVGHVVGPFAWSVWVNTSKNPRLKQVELPQIGMVVDVPKSIALASVALRMQRRTADEFFERCANQYMAVGGGVMYPDLLALPAPAKKVRGWTLRQVTPLTHNVSRLPYPIPPAGADPATYKADEEPPPLGFTYTMPADLVVLDDPPSVGWWCAEESGWSTQGVSDVQYDPSNLRLSFKTTHLAPLALIAPRTRLLPYSAWNIRPTGGRNGNSAALTLECTGLSEPLVFEVGPSSVTLTAPAWPQLQGLVGVPQPLTGGPLSLLLALSARGLHLLPEDRDARWAGVAAKERGAEQAMCADLALLSGVFLIASSKWNQSAPTDECLARISEVTDWEGGVGRTEPHHVSRVFSKEKEDGERRGLVVVRRGSRGFAFSDALDRRESFVALPGVGSVEEVEAMSQSVFGEVHASLLTLLRGQFAVPGASESPLALRLCASSETLELCKTTHPLFTQTLADLMMALRLFSFS